MTRLKTSHHCRAFLGIEGGGTRTTLLLVDTEGRVLKRAESGPANLRLVNDAELARHLRALAAGLPQPASMAIGLAGARTETDRERIRRAAARVWPRVPCYATNDLETALAATNSIAPQPEMAKRRGTKAKAKEANPPLARVLVLSGTGSCCFGQALDGRTAKMGGWGHLLGDKGSGYEIGLRALKAVVFYYDRDGAWTSLGRRVLRALQLNEPNDLISWVQQADKRTIAALAPEVFAAAGERDVIARDILAGAASSLARDAVSCATKLARRGGRIEVVLAGSVLLRQPRFAARVATEIKQSWPRAVVVRLPRESVWGAVELARQKFKVQSSKFKVGVESTPSSRHISTSGSPLSPTEMRHPRSMKLDTMPIRDAIELMLDEEKVIPAALRAEAPKIERAIEWIARAFRRGGRLFYVGAGTSGRLGVLDASECPPTFSTPPDWVQGIIAGGATALWQAVEGAEDDAEVGARAVTFRGVNRRDVVVGIAASGRTPFVQGALREARRRRARTVLLCFNPSLTIARSDRPDLILAPNIGPEILTGSTRLKAGTATKLVLNLFTTLAMVRIGKTLSNLMIDVKPSNTKLRDRAVRIVQALTGADADSAQAALQQAQWNIRSACRELPRG